MCPICYGAWAANFWGGMVGELPRQSRGMEVLWHPAPLILLQLLWTVICLYGLGRVTGSVVRFHRRRDKV